jgi:hypothetical protein
VVSNRRLTSQIPCERRARHLPREEERLLVHDRRIARGRTLWLRYGAAEGADGAVHGLAVEKADAALR